MAEPVVFAQAVEGLFVHGLHAELTDGCRARLEQAGLRLGEPLLPAYPLAAWAGWVRIAAEGLFAGEPLERALTVLGERMIDGYRQTFVGRAALELIREQGPRRFLARAGVILRSFDNYSETRLVERGLGHVELWVNEVGRLPAFTAGVVLGATRVAGASEPRVEVIATDGAGCTCRVTWSERPGS